LKVFQHGWSFVHTDGREAQLIVFSREEEWGKIRCFRCGDLCLDLTRTPDGADFSVLKPLHPTRDDQQHCAACCDGCDLSPKKGILL